MFAMNRMPVKDLMLAWVLSLLSAIDGCSLGGMPQFVLYTRGAIEIKPGQPQTVECGIICPETGDLSGCGIKHNWIAATSEDNFKVHYLSTSQTTNDLVKENYTHYETTEINNNLCPVNGTRRTNIPFSINFTYISPRISELQVYCGIRRSASNLTAITPGVAVLKPAKLVFGNDKQAAVIREGEDAVVSCVRSTMTIPVWQLRDSKNEWSSDLLSDGINSSILLNNGTLELMYDLQDGNFESQNDTNFVQFNITLLNVKSSLNGVTLWCGIREDDGSEPQFHPHPTVLVVIPGENPNPTTIIFSNGSDNHPYLRLQKGGKITCTKRRGYSSDVRVQLLADDGTIPKNSELTISQNQEQLKQLGVSIRESTNENSEHLWQDFDIILTDVTSVMTVQCGARSPEGTHFKFYDHVVIATIVDYTVVPCFETNERKGYIAGISSVSLLSVIIVVLLIVALVVVIFVYVRGCGRHRIGRVATRKEHIEAFTIENDNARHET